MDLNFKKTAPLQDKSKDTVEVDGLVVRDFNDVPLSDLPDVLMLVQAMQTLLSNTLEVYDKVALDLQPKLEIDGEMHAYFKPYKLKNSCLYLEILNANTVSSSLSLTKEQQEAYIFNCFKQIQERRLIDIIEAIDYQCILKFIVSKKTKISIINRTEYKINTVKLASAIVNFYIPMILTKLALLELDSFYLANGSESDSFMLKHIEKQSNSTIRSALNSFLSFKSISLKNEEKAELKIKKEKELLKKAGKK